MHGGVRSAPYEGRTGHSAPALQREQIISGSKTKHDALYVFSCAVGSAGYHGWREALSVIVEILQPV